MGRCIRIKDGKIVCIVKANSKTSGRILLPACWIGKNVSVTLNDTTAIEEVKPVTKTKRAKARQVKAPVISTVEESVPVDEAKVEGKREQTMETCKFRSRYKAGDCDHAFHHTDHEDYCMKCSDYVYDVSE